jgi:GT2 family glycosyltransferase
VSGRITVVVVSRNRREELLHTLPRHEAPVVLVDNASTDGSAGAVRAALPAVRVIEVPRNLGAVARNLGVQVAATPYVAFADDDSWWAPGALARAVAVLDAHPRVGLLAGRALVGLEQRLDPVSAAMAAAPLGRHPDGAGPDILGFAACAAVVRRSAFLQVGGFDPVVRFPGEEERVALDLADHGWLLSYRDDLVVHHHPSPRRDTAHRRRRAVVRNLLLTACMRRPWRVVAAKTVTEWRSGTGRPGILAALRRLPAALQYRRLLCAAVEDSLRRLDLAERAAAGARPTRAEAAASTAVRFRRTE